MPLPAVAAAGIAAGAQIASGALNIFGQGRLNKKTRQWNEKMYGIQRADALADWHMQNEYNSPSATMARLKAAGLNPNLVYGNGADTQAGAVRSSSAPGWNPRSPDFSFVGNALMSYYDVQEREARIDNLKTQNTVQLQEALLKAATTANVAQSTAKGEFDLGLAKDLRETSLEAAQENLRRLKTGTDIELQANERAAALNSANLLTAAETVLKMRAERANTEADRLRILESIKNLQKDNRLKELDIELKKNGIQPSDNIFMRILGRILGDSDVKDFKFGIDKGGFNSKEWNNGYLKKDTLKREWHNGYPK